MNYYISGKCSNLEESSMYKVTRKNPTSVRVDRIKLVVETLGIKLLKCQDIGQGHQIHLSLQIATACSASSR